VVAGGGTALLRASEVLSELRARGDRKLGVAIVKSACAAPLRQIADNAGEDGSVIIDEVLSAKPNFGFDAISCEMVDMFKAGIIDATKVVRTALQNAGSIAGLMLTTDTLVTTVDDRPAVEGAIK